MPYFDFIWTEELIDHIAQHGVSQDDFEEVVRHPEIQGTSHSSGHPAAWGYTADGRFLIAIYEIIEETTAIPVAAYEVEEP